MAENKSRITILKNQSQFETPNPPMSAKDGGGAMAISRYEKGLHLYRCNKEQRKSGDGEVIFCQSVYKQVVDHLSSNTSREQGGLLLGYEIHFADDTSLVFVTHSLPAQYSEGTPARLAFTQDTWAKFDEQTDELHKFDPALRRVGWYHSHPEIDIFLSKPDLDVCSNFTRPTQIALVVDPVYDRGGFFIRGEEGFRQYTPQGFWEFHDLTEETIITWKNMSLAETDIEAYQKVEKAVSQRQVPETETSPSKDGQQPAVSQLNTLPSSWAENNNPVLIEKGGSRPGIPPWIFVLVVAAFTGLFLWTTIGSMGQIREFLYNLDSRLIEQQNISKAHAEKLNAISEQLKSLIASGSGEAHQEADTAPDGKDKNIKVRKKPRGTRGTSRSNAISEKPAGGAGSGAAAGTSGKRPASTTGGTKPGDSSNPGAGKKTN